MTDATTPADAKQIANLLQTALGYLNRNENGAAEALLDRALQIQPEEANALQLLGLIRRAQGQLPQAETLYRRSLVANPEQPHVHFNLGTLLYHLGRFTEAIAALEEAVRQKPNYAEAYLRLGQAWQAEGDLAAAERAYRQALKLQPNYLMAKQSLGGILNDQMRAPEAERILRGALAACQEPRQKAALQHNLAMSMKQQRRFDDALALFDTAQAAVPDMPHVDYNRANTLQELGRGEEAVDFYRRAVIRNPLDIAAHDNLNRLLYRLGQDDEFLSSLDEVAALYPDVGTLPLTKANLLMQLERHEEAAEAYRRAAPLLPDNVTPHDGLGMIAARLGQFDEAIAAHERALAMEPQNAPAWTNFAETLLRAGDPQRARDAAERAMAVNPNLQHALAMWGLALRMLDDPREDALNDYENLVRVYELPPPEGYSDMAAFNRDLNAELDRLHRDRREALDQSLRTGTQTLGDLFGRNHVLVEKLRARIDDAVLAYIAAMKEDEKHPLFRRRARAKDYSASWSARLHDCGYHANHVHPAGWISSCYYVALPDAVADTQAQQGWIKFGEPAFDAGFKEPVRRTIQPRPGMLVLFPSYMWHGTIAFRSETSRTTIAFDAVPHAD